MTTSKLRRLALALLTGSAIAVVSLTASVVAGSLTPAYAQVSEEFQLALEPYGMWRQHPRWGDVWVPDQRPRGWRPYSVGHWVYTDDWGWYWISDDDEADWGWITYHYGRWVAERGNWFWVPGQDWSPAWVDWRRGTRYVGWAPLSPDDVIDQYGNDPSYWIFVEPRYVTAPRVRTYFMPAPRARDLVRTTVIVNRAFRTDGRIAVNPGISPAFIGAASRRPIETYRVRPRVLAGTQGVSGAVTVRREDFRQRGAPRGPSMMAPVSVQRTTTVIQPATSVPPPQPLRQDERGRLGTHPPRAAQSGDGAAPLQQQQQQTPAAQPPSPMSPPPAPQRQGPGARPAAPAGSAPVAAPPASPPPAAAPPPGAMTPPPAAAPPRPAPSMAPAQRSGEPSQARPERRIAPQTPPPSPPAMAPTSSPPPVQSRPAPPPPVLRAPAPPPPPAAPVVRPAPPPPPPPPPVARPAPPPPPPPPAARPAAPPPPPPPPPPPAARPAAPPPPPPAAVRPPPPPAAARPAPPAGAPGKPPGKPPRKPGEPEEKK